MRLKSKPLAAILFVILFGSIAFTTAMNWWQTESTKVPAKFTEGEAAGEYNPADIRGSYTFQNIQDAFSVPVEDLAAAFAIPASSDPGAFAVKELEALYTAQAAAGQEIGTASVRYFVALYTQLPYEFTEEVFLPESAVAILQNLGVLTAEQQAYLDTHTVSLTAAPDAATPVPSTEAASTAVATGTVHTDSADSTTIKGKTTFQELLDWGVAQTVIEGIIGKPMPAGGIKVKDYCTAQNLDFETIKLALQAEVDKVKP